MIRSDEISFLDFRFQIEAREIFEFAEKISAVVKVMQLTVCCSDKHLRRTATRRSRRRRFHTCSCCHGKCRSGT